jgi:hypothetical protein
MMLQPPRAYGPFGPSREQVATIEQKAVQSPKSLLDWEKAWLEDRRRRHRRHHRLSKNAVNLAADASDLD